MLTVSQPLKVENCADWGLQEDALELDGQLLDADPAAEALERRERPPRP